MSTLELKAYEIFRNKLGDKEAEVILAFLEEKAEDKYLQKKDVFLTKEDKIELMSKIESSKTEMIKWFLAFFITMSLMILGLYLRR